MYGQNRDLQLILGHGTNELLLAVLPQQLGEVTAMISDGWHKLPSGSTWQVRRLHLLLDQSAMPTQYLLHCYVLKPRQNWTSLRYNEQDDARPNATALLSNHSMLPTVVPSCPLLGLFGNDGNMVARDILGRGGSGCKSRSIVLFDKS